MLHCLKSNQHIIMVTPPFSTRQTYGIWYGAQILVFQFDKMCVF